jgi:AcrR family transcriptional regulator
MTASPTQPKDAARTRERILGAARREFSGVGFGPATVRSIAGRAGVSPNLITRYFGGKAGLFAAAAEVDLGVEDMFRGPRRGLGRRMAETVLARWDALRGEEPLLALMRAAGEHEAAAIALADLLDRESLDPLRAQLVRYGLDESDASARAAAIDAFVYGVTARYRMLRDALQDREAATEWMAGTIQRLVDAP